MELKEALRYMKVAGYTRLEIAEEPVCDVAVFIRENTLETIRIDCIATSGRILNNIMGAVVVISSYTKNKVQLKELKTLFEEVNND